MIGKWNKSVILTYIGLIFGVIGIYIVLTNNNINYAFVCLIVTGICDLFDGTVARMCKRTSEEKEFGIQLDSLVDVFNFIALPIVILFGLGLNKIYDIAILSVYGICGIARLAYFNIKTADSNKKVSYYTGLPVTFAALIFPIFNLLSNVIVDNIFSILLRAVTFIVACLFITDFKVVKPKTKTAILLLFIAIIVSILYLFVL